MQTTYNIKLQIGTMQTYCYLTKLIYKKLVCNIYNFFVFDRIGVLCKLIVLCKVK